MEFNLREHRLPEILHETLLQFRLRFPDVYYVNEGITHVDSITKTVYTNCTDTSCNPFSESWNRGIRYQGYGIPTLFEDAARDTILDWSLGYISHQGIPVSYYIDLAHLGYFQATSMDAVWEMVRQHFEPDAMCVEFLQSIYRPILPNKTREQAMAEIHAIFPNSKIEPVMEYDDSYDHMSYEEQENFEGPRVLVPAALDKDIEVWVEGFQIGWSCDIPNRWRVALRSEHVYGNDLRKALRELLVQVEQGDLRIICAYWRNFVEQGVRFTKLLGA